MFNTPTGRFLRWKRHYNHAPSYNIDVIVLVWKSGGWWYIIFELEGCGEHFIYPSLCWIFPSITIIFSMLFLFFNFRTMNILPKLFLFLLLFVTRHNDMQSLEKVVDRGKYDTLLTQQQKTKNNVLEGFLSPSSPHASDNVVRIWIMCTQ